MSLKQWLSKGGEHTGLLHLFAFKFHLQQESCVLGYPEVPRDKVLVWPPFFPTVFRQQLRACAGARRSPPVPYTICLHAPRDRVLLPLVGSSGGHHLAVLLPQGSAPLMNPSPDLFIETESGR